MRDMRTREKAAVFLGFLRPPPGKNSRLRRTRRCSPHDRALSGPPADRVGPSRICFLGSLIGAFGLAYAAYASGLSQVYLGFGIGVGVGVGFTYVPAIAAVQRWFVRRRGFASGIAVAGIGLGTLAMPVIAQGLMRNWVGAVLGSRWASAWRSSAEQRLS
jgi:MFS family permease